MSHENSITVTIDGKHYVLNSHTGQILRGPFDTREEADWRARMRSDMMRELRPEPQGLGSLAEAMNEDYSPGVPEIDRWNNPEPTEYTPHNWPEDIYTAQAKPDPIEEMLKRADQGKPVERPGYFGTTETPGVPQQPQAPTQAPATKESWAEYLRRLLRGR